LFVSWVVSLATGSAYAEIAMISPTPRSGAQETGPCGAAGSTRSTNVSTFRPGETIFVEWNETVEYNGHYRIAFDDSGDDVFENPNNPDDNFPFTLVDQISDEFEGRHEQPVTLPRTPCDNCTLQLVQVTTTTVPYDSFFFQCADITIAGEPVEEESYGSCGGPAATMCCSTGSAGGGLAAIVLVGLVVRRRRTGSS
jgi:MYXO-CTERM domain-containing protein